MSFVPAQCPNCLKAIQIPTDVPISKCMYCGTDVSLPSHSVVPPSVSVSNLLGMARTVSMAQNLPEAESYYNRVLELDPKNSEAWAGKGKSAGWQSTISNIRIQEMVVAFNHAIGTADDCDRASTIDLCVLELNHMVATLYGMANKHMNEYVALDDVWSSYLSQVGVLLDGLSSALLWDANNKTTLENIVYLCRDNIEGVSYRDPYDNNQSKAWSLSPEYEQILTNMLNEASSKLKALDPDYSAPTIEKKKPDACFVVTATVGDEYHPAVILLRKFRNEFLAGNVVGNAFIRWYYKNGPRLANVIGKSNFRRVASYTFIVAPAYFVASMAIKIRDVMNKK